MNSVPVPADSEVPERQPPSGAEIYRHAIEEYRFEVRLSRKLTKLRLGLNVALLAVVATLLQDDSDSWAPRDRRYPTLETKRTRWQLIVYSTFSGGRINESASSRR